MSEKEDKRKSKKDDDELKKKQLEHLKEGGRKNSAGSESEVDTNKLNEEIGTESFKIVSLLGVGSQGRVYLVQLNDTKNFYAMKVFKKEKIINNEKTTRSILTEHRFLATSQHPFITQLLYSFHSHERLFMVMEFCAGGELFTLIKRQPIGRLTEDQVRFYGSEVLLVLEFVHSKGYIYRDLKPENILIHSDGHIRMADFGLSKQSELPPQIQIVERKEKKSLFGKSKTTMDVSVGEVLRTNSLVGSVHYLAPEVLISSANEGYNVMADWWAFGVLLYDMLFGFPPFQGRTNEEIIMKIVHGEYSFPDDIPAGPQIKNLIKSLLKVDPKKRFCSKHGASDIKNHPFFEGTNWGLLRHRAPPIIPIISSPCDTSNFMIYDEDQDSVDFQFFSELQEDPNAISEEFQDKFDVFKFKSSAFEGILNQRKSSLSDSELKVEVRDGDRKDKKKRKERRKSRKSSRHSVSSSSSPDVIIDIAKKEPENESKKELNENENNNANKSNSNNEPDKQPAREEKKETPVVEEKKEEKEEKEESDEEKKEDVVKSNAVPKKSKANLRKKD